MSRSTVPVRIVKRSGKYTIEARDAGGWRPLVTGNESIEQARACEKWWPDNDLVWDTATTGTLSYDDERVVHAR